MGLLKALLNAAGSDARLSKLFEDMVEYAQIYQLARRRQDGCAGKGELFALKQEFLESITSLAEYALKKSYIVKPFEEDTDVLAPVLGENWSGSLNQI